MIESKPFIKYLSIMMDHRLIFKEPMTHVTEKEGELVAALMGIMPNIGGLHSAVRTISLDEGP